MKTLRLIGMAILAVVLSVNFAACSDDDEETANDELFSIITSTAWEQDGDNDIFVVSSDGTGFIYGSPELWRSNTKTGFAFTWSYANDIVTVNTNAYYADGVKAQDLSETEKLVVVSYNSNQIVFRLTGDNEGDIWTWTSYK